MKKISIIIISAVLIMAAVLYVSSAGFIDVPEYAYYAEAAARMNEKGILTGYGDNCYNGDDNITRAQMAVVAVRLLGKEGEAKRMTGATVFDDFDDSLDWATGYVNYASGAKIINGDGDGTYRPNDSVKYEEVIKIIVCVLGLDDGVTIDPADWSKEYIEVADKAGLLEGLIGKKGEPMKRSDIAIICDASVDVLEKRVSAVTAEATTEKPKVTATGTTAVEEGGEVVEETTTFSELDLPPYTPGPNELPEE